nr:MFS transporter [uncultured Acidocella sp.]
MAIFISKLTPVERRTFWACFGGWGLDAFDFMVFTLAIPALMMDFHVGRADVGALGSAALFASAFGGWLGGAISDKIGRVRALQVMILWFSLATGLSALAQNFYQLLVLKALQGLGFGGEWAAGAVLMSETIRPAWRGRALAGVQSAWAVGWGGSVLAYGACFYLLPEALSWRVLFGIGLLPALLILFVQRSVPEPVHQAGKTVQPMPFLGIFRPEVLRMTVLSCLLAVGAHGGYYALTTFLPTYLKTSRHLSVTHTSLYLAVIIVAFFCGCLASAALIDRIGRRRNISLFAVCSALSVALYLLLPLNDTEMLIIGFPVGFFAAGIPSSMGALFTELFPAGTRGTAVGFCYNFGRVVASFFPLLVGIVSRSVPLGTAIGVSAAGCYALVVLAVAALPETRQRALADTIPAEAD